MESKIEITLTGEEVWMIDWALMKAANDERKLSKLYGVEQEFMDRCLQKAQEYEALRSKIFSDYRIKVHLDDLEKEV